MAVTDKSEASADTLPGRSEPFHESIGKVRENHREHTCKNSGDAVEHSAK